MVSVFDYRGSPYDSGWDSRRDWVNPRQNNLTEDKAPYAYSEYFMWRDETKVDPHKGTYTAWSAKGVQAVYSDRLSQWDNDKFRAACDAVKTQGRIRQWSKEDATNFLTVYFGKTTTAVALAEGCNPSNGYPYWIFWFEHPAPSPSSSVEREGADA
jgi:hypothetical protein